MIDYIKENCELPPLEEPLYDMDTQTWDLYFEEKGNQHYVLEDDLICLAFESLEEVNQILKECLQIQEGRERILAEKQAERLKRQAKT